MIRDPERPELDEAVDASMAAPPAVWAEPDAEQIKRQLADAMVFAETGRFPKRDEGSA